MRVGILGGGQLGKMLALAGYPLNLQFLFYDADATCCARELAPTIHAAFDDLAALQAFADQVDIITYETENIPILALTFLQQHKPIFPSLHAMATTQDRLLEKECLKRLGVPTAAFMSVQSKDDLQQAASSLRLPFVLKTRRHGYDGKGQVVIRSLDQLTAIDSAMLLAGCIAEEWVHYQREFSVIAVKSASSEIAFYDLCENRHQDGILIQSQNKLQDPALQAVAPYVSEIIHSFSYHGVITVEFFEKQHSHYLVNEIAPRVHNSGHWTIEGAYTSQFQNHLRAGLNWPLGSTRSRCAVIMDNMLGQLPMMQDVLTNKNAYVHFYGKSEKKARKLGHITRLIGS